MVDISNFGFTRGRIAECIVTTYNEDGSSNAAPMGVFSLNEGEVSMKIHTKHDTYSNIVRNGGCAINLVFDPYLFLRATLSGRGKGGAEPEVGEDEVAPCEGVKAPYLKDASAYLEVQLRGHKEFVKEDRHGKSEVSSVSCEVVGVVVNKKHPMAVNRGLNVAIELAIHLSRDERERVEEYLGIMKKALSKEEYERIEGFLQKYL